MKKDKLGKFLSILGKIIALTSVVLFMLKMIPANGIIQWSMLLVANSSKRGHMLRTNGALSTF